MPSKYGLIGKNISYSFSKQYFTNKFENEKINASYQNFDFQNIEEFKQLNFNEIKGFNVTIPYKISIIPFLDKISKKAKKIGAVNVIRITKNGKLKGYNSDCYGFMESIKPLLQKNHTKALILGTGGASKAIFYALKKLKIKPVYVSRNESNYLTYKALDQNILDAHQIIINCTPLGTSPNIDASPDIPYQFITKNHLVYDLIYNPETTLFLAKAKKQGATTKNGLEMLNLQAEKAWEIWNK